MKIIFNTKPGIFFLVFREICHELEVKTIEFWKKNWSRGETKIRDILDKFDKEIWKKFEKWQKFVKNVID